MTRLPWLYPAWMPRTGRALADDICYHVINRGNAKNKVFHNHEDYNEFIQLLTTAIQRDNVSLLAFCLMPNHFHLVLRPRKGEDLSSMMRWLMTAQVRNYHKRNKTSGHLWQGRFKCFPIQTGEHLLTVLRYVERNPLRAKLVRRAEKWPWSSLPLRLETKESFLNKAPVDMSGDAWLDWIHQPQTSAELEKIRSSVNRCTPYGNSKWVITTSKKLGLEYTLRPPGRPKLTLTD